LILNTGKDQNLPLALTRDALVLTASSLIKFDKFSHAASLPPIAGAACPEMGKWQLNELICPCLY
jgi:hypothetical protein